MVFSPDNRQILSYSSAARVAEKTAVQILSVFPDGYVALGSGTITGANDVVTAAHVVYSSEHGGKATSTLITPQRFDTLKPFGAVAGVPSNIPEGWVSSESYPYDYALITMSRPIGYYTGWVDLGIVNTYNASQLTQSYGYAGDLRAGNSLIYTPGSEGVLYGNILRYYGTMDAAGGQSGSGILSQGPAPTLIGLVSHEDITYNYNGILAMTHSVRTELSSWMQSNDTALSPPIISDAPRDTVDTLTLFYYAFLNRDPDTQGLNYWVQTVLSGTHIESVATSFFNSTEFSSSSVASLSNPLFTDYLYSHILGRSADRAGHDFWVHALEQGALRSALASSFSQSKEYYEAHRLDLYEIWHRHYNDFALEAYGTNENEILVAAQGESMLFGDGGNDTLNGGVLDDYLWGGKGNDLLTGGEGRDFFAWDAAEGIDTITDFNTAQDTLRLRSDFSWSWGSSSQGWLVLRTADGEGVVLTGISPDQSNLITIIHG
ncbi:MAG: DUF4214 domain-containing protein [Sulfuricurvum sp.]|nr:DUF4214 domain-containing protein [Sulfuricurvum sp.]